MELSEETKRLLQAAEPEGDYGETTSMWATRILTTLIPTEFQPDFVTGKDNAIVVRWLRNDWDITLFFQKRNFGGKGHTVIRVVNPNGEATVDQRWFEAKSTLYAAFEQMKEPSPQVTAEELRQVGNVIRELEWRDEDRKDPDKKFHETRVKPLE